MLNSLCVKVHFIASGLATTISFAAAAYLTSVPSLRNLLLWGAASSFLVVPYTALVLMPINNRLGAIHSSGKLLENEVEETSEGEGLARETMQKINVWRGLHRVRLALGTSMWLSGLVALGYNL